MQEYNSFIGRTDLKDQNCKHSEMKAKHKLAHKTVHETAAIILIHNTFTLYRESQNTKKLNCAAFLLQ
jgi:hypothetical protein